jgi:hypothetical protein
MIGEQTADEIWTRFDLDPFSFRFFFLDESVAIRGQIPREHANFM